MVSGVFVSAFLLVLTSVIQAEYVTNKYEKENPRCPLGPVVTATICGCLGNTLWDFMSILALSRLLPGGFQPFMRRYHFNYISKYFQTPLLPFVEDIPLNCSCWNRSDLLQVNYGENLHYYTVENVKKWSNTDNVVLRSPCVAGESIMHELEFIKTRLKFKPELIKEADQVFQEIATKYLKQENLTDQQLTFVGVHVRRTNYLQFLRKEERVDARFFNFGFDYFRNRKEFGKCVFVVLSDDQKWVEDNITSNKTNKDVFIVGTGRLFNPGLDLAILAFANHTIFDFGSFGLFGAVYCGGEVVTSTSYGQSHKFIQYKRFHFFDPVPDKEVIALPENGDYRKRNW